MRMEMELTMYSLRSDLPPVHTQMYMFSRDLTGQIPFHVSRAHRTFTAYKSHN